MTPTADDLAARLAALDAKGTLPPGRMCEYSNLSYDLIAALRALEAKQGEAAARWKQARWQLVDFGVYSDEGAAERAIDAAIQQSGEKNDSAPNEER